jgi:predicted dehydrogenase
MGSGTEGVGEAGVSRRELVAASAAVAASALFATGNYAYAQGSDRIKVGLIGCGGRGTGAANDCFRSSQGVELVAMGDVFADRLNGSKGALKDQLKDAFKVTDDTSFVGLDAYKGVLASSANLVILATPPGFRPIHFDAAVKAGKNVFMEKPVASDAPGIRTVLAAGELATQKKLAVVAGTQRRHQAPYVATIAKLQAGAIGDIVGGQVYWNGGGVGNGYGDKGSQTDLEWMIRHWYPWTWLSGDHIVEQHVHNIDIACWVMGGHPQSAMGVGGRSQRTEARFGNIFDHFAIDFVYPGDVHILSMCRHWDGTPGNVSERFVGTKGVTNAAGSISGPNEWRYQGQSTTPYVQEHADLIASIRAGKPLNEARQVAESTLAAIMGRMAAYTGQIITWEQALNSQDNIVPDMAKPAAAIPVPAVSIPGRTEFK